jgi:hypothetical protein
MTPEHSIKFLNSSCLFGNPNIWIKLDPASLAKNHVAIEGRRNTINQEETLNNDYDIQILKNMMMARSESAVGWIQLHFKLLVVSKL